MENVANDSNQNHVDSNNLKETLSEKLEITTAEESDIVNIDLERNQSINESDVFTFPVQSNGDRSHSTSPSKQRVIDTINEVISDHLPVETQDDSDVRVLDNNLMVDDIDQKTVLKVDDLKESEFEQNDCKSPYDGPDQEEVKSVESEKTFIKPVASQLKDDGIYKQTNLIDTKQTEDTTLETTCGESELTRDSNTNNALPKSNESMETHNDRVNFEPKHENDFQSVKNNILVSQMQSEDIQNSIKDLSGITQSESLGLETEELNNELVVSSAEESIDPKTAETIVPTIDITEDSLVEELVTQMIDNNQEPVEAIPELEKCSADNNDISEMSEKKEEEKEEEEEEPAPEWLDMLGNGLLKKKVLIITDMHISFLSFNFQSLWMVQR